MNIQEDKDILAKAGNFTARLRRNDTDLPGRKHQ